jgi:hypothetical protein
MSSKKKWEYPIYLEFLNRPIKIVLTEKGTEAIFKFDETTGGWLPGDDFWTEVRLGREIRQVTEEEFIQLVEKKRCLFLKGEGTVCTLYELINAMQDAAKEKGRELTDTEKAIIAGLRRETYTLFEQALEKKHPLQANRPENGRSG